MSGAFYTQRANTIDGSAVLFAGDSIVSLAAYETLGMAYRRYGVVNMGMPGQRIRAISEALTASAQSFTPSAQPAGAIFMGGVNNYWATTDEAATQVADMLAAISALRRMARGNVVVAIPTSLEPGTPNTVDARARLPQIEKTWTDIERAASLAGAPLVDVSAYTRGADKLLSLGSTSDGVHPRADLSRRIRGLLDDAVSRYF